MRMLWFVEVLKKRMAETSFNAGYNWASGELVSGRERVEKLEARALAAFEANRPFDEGILAACRRWNKLLHSEKQTNVSRVNLIRAVLADPKLYQGVIDAYQSDTVHPCQGPTSTDD